MGVLFPDALPTQTHTDTKGFSPCREVQYFLVVVLTVVTHSIVLILEQLKLS